LASGIGKDETTEDRGDPKVGALIWTNYQTFKQMKSEIHGIRAYSIAMNTRQIVMQKTYLESSA